jgi:hypothetical protein
MDIQSLDSALIALVEKKIELSGMDYNDEKYDELEDELHDLEDELIDNYGSYLEEALEDVHDEFCPDNDVLLPIAYLANNYIRTGQTRNGKPMYDVDYGDGVLVEVDDFPGRDARIVIVPNPVRIMLNVKGESKVLAWQAQ